MAIELNHTTVPAHDRQASADFYTQLFGFEFQGLLGHFAAVRIVGQRLTFDFYDDEDFEHHHYAFKVSETEFDKIFARMQQRGLDYGSGPRTPEDGEINHWNGGRGVYFRDPNGHLLELLTRDYTEEQFQGD